jgi:hypothetical protein
MNEDEKVSLGDPWGPRRYGGLRAIKDAFAQREREGVDQIELVNKVRKAFLGFGMSPAAETGT